MSWTRGAARALRAMATRAAVPQPAAALRAATAASARAECVNAHRALPGGAPGRTAGGASSSSRTGPLRIWEANGVRRPVASTTPRLMRALVRLARDGTLIVPNGDAEDT